MEYRKTSIIEDFRILEKELGKNKAEAIFQMISNYSQIQISVLATKADVESVRTELYGLRSEFHKELGTMKETVHKELGTMKETFHKELGTMKESTHRELGTMRETFHNELGTMKENTHRELGVMKETIHKSIANVSWRVAGLLIAQSAIIAALFKLFQ